MMSKNFRFIIEIVSACAIVVSLVFLGLEVNQSNTLAKASIRQSLNETDMEIYQMQMDKGIIIKALYKIEKNIPIDDYEEFMVVRFQTFNFRDFDNSYYQYRIGLFDENNWLAYERLIKALLKDEYVQIMLEKEMSNFSTEFQTELKSLLKELN
jgi:hypothetical protein